MLDAHDIHVGYTDVPITHGVNIALPEQDMGVIVGPNGAGKSTVLKAIFGLLPLQKGRITWHDQDITNWTPEQRVQNGMAYVPQEYNIFPSLTVLENLQMGAYSSPKGYRAALDRVFAFFPSLDLKKDDKAGILSGGQRQMVAIGRALMIQPRMLLLDEPTVGLSPKYMADMLSYTRTIHKAGVGVLMVEQNAKQALAIADKGFVLSSGLNRFTGTGRELLDNPKVAEAFLGG